MSDQFNTFDNRLFILSEYFFVALCMRGLYETPPFKGCKYPDWDKHLTESPNLTNLVISYYELSDENSSLSGENYTLRPDFRHFHSRRV